MTSQATISGWLDKLYSDDSLSHMVVICDTWDHEDYPRYVRVSEDVREVVKSSHGSNMQRVMEVYSRNHSRESQLSVARAFNYD